MYEVDIENVRYVLIDTPGFDDTYRKDWEVLSSITSYLHSQYNAKELLSGIIYLHPLSRPRVQGSTMTQIKVFKGLCGTDNYQSVLLGTTFWEGMNLSEAETRHNELLSSPGFLGDVKDLGARTARVYKERDACINLVKSFAEKPPAALKIQKEVAAANGALNSSAAAAALSPELHRLRLQQEKDLAKQRRQAEESAKEAAKQQKEKERKMHEEATRQEQQRRKERERLQREAEEREESARYRREVAQEQERKELEKRRIEAARQAKLEEEAKEKAMREARDLERVRQAAEQRKQAREQQLERQRRYQREEEAAFQRALRLTEHSHIPLRLKGGNLVRRPARQARKC